LPRGGEPRLLQGDVVRGERFETATGEERLVRAADLGRHGEGSGVVTGLDRILQRVQRRDTAVRAARPYSGSQLADPTTAVVPEPFDQHDRDATAARLEIGEVLRRESGVLDRDDVRDL